MKDYGISFNMHAREMVQIIFKVNILPADVLATNVDRASADKILTQLSRNIPGSALQGLMTPKILNPEYSRSYPCRHSKCQNSRSYPCRHSSPGH